MSINVSDSDSPAIVVEYKAGLAILRINRPGDRNSLSVQTLEELDRSLLLVKQRDDIYAIIVTGTGDVFASGANIRELSALTATNAKSFARLGQTVFGKLSGSRQTSIAAINGYCMGGGLDLALACDLRCASASAVFAHPGGRLGIITGWGGTQRMPRLVGTANALELFATARRIGSDEALRIGLITQIGDPVLECAIDLLR